jgi:hypothetical protein
MSSGAAVYRPSETTPAVAPDSFDARLREIARELRSSISDLSERETEFLYDLAREESRYPMPTVRKLCALSRRSRNPKAREAFAELIREYSIPADADAAVTATFDLETRATGPADVAQRQFERDKNPITYARVKDALELQVAVSQLALAAVLRWGQRNGLERAPDGRGR